MAMRTLCIALAVGCLVGCETPQPPTTPADEPMLPEEYRSEPGELESDSSELDAPDPDESEASEPEAVAPEAPEPDAPAPDSGGESSGGSQGCDGLAKGRCKVTQGCAWSDQKRACVLYKEDF